MELAQWFAIEFQALTGYEPYAWQIALFNSLVLGTIPKNINLPTGSGKTSAIPVWLLAFIQNPLLRLPVSSRNRQCNKDSKHYPDCERNPFVARKVTRNDRHNLNQDHQSRDQQSKGGSGATSKVRSHAQVRGTGRHPTHSRSQRSHFQDGNQPRFAQQHSQRRGNTYGDDGR